MQIKTLWRQASLLAIAALTIGGLPLIYAPAAFSQALMEQRGTLQPMRQEYTFAGQKNQAILISMASDEFDAALSLLDLEGKEIATNDDYGRTVNAAIVITLPSTGTYKILARSFSGEGGNYTVTVRPATAYDQAYAQAAALYTEGKLEAAALAYSAVIQMDASQPIAYLDRGDVVYAQGNVQGLIADYQKAIDLYEKAGDSEAAQMLQEQLQYIQDMPEQQSINLSYPEHTASMTP